MSSQEITTALWLIGSGNMGKAYEAVLADLEQERAVIGRSESGAAAFTQASGTPCQSGGLARALERSGAAPQKAIVATNVGELAGNCLSLIEAGCREILVEKPAGLDPGEIDRVAEAARAAGARVLLAYNRRFYGATRLARRFIEEDGGVVSFFFEFTELADRVGASAQPDDVKANWFYANSTHVVDLAFHLGGMPSALDARVLGGLDWHPKAERFVGSGVSESGAAFAYWADWNAPGRWAVEVNTAKRRLLLKPMEQLQVQHRGAFAIEPVPLEDDLDTRFKPGLWRQTHAFLTGEGAEAFIDIEAHAFKTRKVYQKMLEPQCGV
ncbi:MAG: Gfo/Idh/MocA family oxidoreductase [Neomegalonema sp.]|nr:Gfo/Idh/MocA family oxidoreductase [Neomegalonema sp.]